jgi:SulP family sulfate permease
MPGKIFPISEWLPAYRRAGLTSAAVVIPQAMAYAAIAGLPLVVGLYTALVPLVVYAVMGTSRPLSVTSTSTIAILSAAVLGHVAPGGDPAALVTATATLSGLVGAFLLLAGMLRVGAVASLISDPVLTGFKAGIGLVIVVDQLPKLLGIHIDKAGFFRDLLAMGAHLPETSLPNLVFALVMLALMLGLEHFTSRLPAPLIMVAVGIAAARYAGLEGAGIALGIALMSFVETTAAGRAFIRRGDPQPNPNQELLATGLANLAGGLFQSMPAGGGTSQTAVNDGAGARSQVAGLVAAAVSLATLLFLAPLFGLMPHPTLSAVVVVASIGLISPADCRAILRIRSMQFHWALIAVVGVLLLGTLKGILVAVLASLVALVVHANRHESAPGGDGFVADGVEPRRAGGGAAVGAVASNGAGAAVLHPGTGRGQFSAERDGNSRAGQWKGAFRWARRKRIQST